MKRLLLLFVPLVFFFGCELLEEDNTTVEWCVEFHISADIEAEYIVQRDIYDYSDFCDQGRNYYFTGENTSGIIGDGETTGLCCFTKYTSSDDDEDTAYIQMITDENGCADIEGQIYKDGNWVSSENIQLGCISGINSDCDFCNQNGNEFIFVIDLNQ
tara:strand:- start:49 stop:522 length:474 start_codon:yes stop_codon:yes gene_type:complete